jgi:ABC-2 type transport system ATP-binding protein
MSQLSDIFSFMSLAIEVKNLVKKFEDKNAVDGIDLSIEEGSIYGFLGPNGAGKSTTVKMLVTLLKPNSGEVKILGKDLYKDFKNIRLNIGAALQETSLDNLQTGRELLTIQGELYGLSKSQIKRRIEELQELIDLGDDFDKLIKTYSGGMKRRIDLASALIHKPQLLFLDEPTTGLDPTSRNKIWKEVEKLNKEGMTIFLTTQYLEEADYLADEIGIINEGKIVAQDTPKNLKSKIGSDVISIATENPVADVKQIEALEDVSKVKFNDNQIIIYTKDGGHLVPKVIRLLDEMKIEVKGLEIRKPTLDDVFLGVTKTGGKIE